MAIIALVTPGDPPVVVGISVSRVYFQCFIVIGDGFVVLAFFGIGKSPKAVGLSRIRILIDGFI
ncbi:MAG: hypothetical protein V3S72_02630 [Desulfobacterales bacterium]